MPDNPSQGSGTGGGFLESVGLKKSSPDPTPSDASAGNGGSQGATGAQQEPQQQQQQQEQEQTPEDNTGLKNALQAERTRAREAERELKRIREAQEFEAAQAQRSERERLEAERDRAASEAQQAKDTLLRIRVGAQKNLDLEFASRLKGETEEEMLEDADRLLEAMGNRLKASGLDGGARSPAPEQKSVGQAHNELILGLTGRSPDQNT